MPSVEMKRSMRICVPKTKEVVRVKVLRSGRKVCVESSGETKMNTSSIVTTDQDLMRLIDVFNDPLVDCSHGSHWGNGVDDNVRESDAIVVDDVVKSEPQFENKVLPSGLCSIGERRFGIVYSRKRNRMGVKYSDSCNCSDKHDDFNKCGGRKFGLRFFYRKRRRIAKTSAYTEGKVDRYEKNRSLCVIVDTPSNRSCEPSAIFNSVVRYMCTAKVGLKELSGFLQSHPIAGVFASFGIHFLLNDACTKRSGICKIYDTSDQLRPLFDLDFSCVPLCFLHLHATMWFKSLHLSCLFLNADRTSEDESTLVDVISCTSTQSSKYNILTDEVNDSGVVKLANSRIGVSESAFCALPYRSSVATRSSSQRRRKRSMRTRRARNPSSLGLQGVGSFTIDSGVKKNVVLRLGNPQARKSIMKKSSNFDIKLMKSSLLATGKDIDSISCSVNLLIVEKDRCYRECGASVTLELLGSSEWILAVKKDGLFNCYHMAQKGQEVKPSCTNRYTYAIIWYVEAGWKLEFTDRKEWAIFKELFKICGDRNLELLPPAKAIPIPGVYEVPICDALHDVPYVRPESYIKKNDDELSRALFRRTPNYDMDCQDEDWLNEFNSKSNPEIDLFAHVTDSTFELIIDAFEKAVFFDPNQFIFGKAPVDLSLDLASREVMEAIYSFWVTKRKQKQGPLLAVFKLNEPKKTPLAPKPVLRKKRSMKCRHKNTFNGNLNGRGKELRVLQATSAAKKNAMDEKSAMLEAKQAVAVAKSALEVALEKRRRAQTLMANADLAMYKATMAIRLAEAVSQAAEPKQAISLYLDDA